ncbi:hypothetical protein Tco_0025047 [Tanacetum coccineum]
MYVDGGSASDVLYEHFFNRLLLEIKSRMIPATSLILGFIGEISWPLGQISLLISLGDKEHSTSTLMDFMVVRSPSPYNDIVERPEIKKDTGGSLTEKGKMELGKLQATKRKPRCVCMETLIYDWDSQICSRAPAEHQRRISSGLNDLSPGYEHRRLPHLNFGVINHLARHGLGRRSSYAKKFELRHLCSACAMGKNKKKPHKPKSEDTNQEKLYLFHMDLYGPMRVASVNRKESTILQNGVVERHNRALIEAARTMLIYAKAPLFLWAEAVATHLERPVSTRLQLHEQALFCYYDAFLTSVEPKNYKEALTQACWIEAMQEELHEFECLEVDDSLGNRSNGFPDKVWSLLFKNRFIRNPLLKWLDLMLFEFSSHMLSYEYNSSTKWDVKRNPECIMCKDSLGQPTEGFVDLDIPNHLYMLKQALYGLGTSPTRMAKPTGNDLHAVKKGSLKYLRRKRFNTGRLFLPTLLGFNKILCTVISIARLPYAANNVNHSRSKHIDIRSTSSKSIAEIE